MTKEDVLVKIKALVHAMHSSGFFISGCISVDDAAPCTHCGHQMKLVESAGGLIKRKCDKCDGVDIKHLSTPDIKHLTVPKNLPTLNTDSPLCTQCGDLMIRRGSCYYCDSCGTSSGCS